MTLVSMRSPTRSSSLERISVRREMIPARVLSALVTKQSLMVSFSSPSRRMTRMASATVWRVRSSTNSVFMILPAQSSGYFSSSLMSLRVSGSACLRIRLTTLAGISSTRSTASSIYNSSITAFSSVSEKRVIRLSCRSASISTKASAASSLGRSRNSRGRASSESSPKIAAISAAFRVTRMSFTEE